ncbi:sugar-binding domain-containing protein [Pseudothermotoga lettingae]
MGIAGGEEKVKAICAAMKGRFINILITDIRTAREIVRVMEQ